jgi:hypothetical protein
MKSKQAPPDRSLGSLITSVWLRRKQEPALSNCFPFIGALVRGQGFDPHQDITGGLDLATRKRLKGDAADHANSQRYLPLVRFAYLS